MAPTKGKRPGVGPPGAKAEAADGPLDQHHQSHTNTFARLSPLRRARAELLLGLLSERGSFLVDTGRAARAIWEARGLSLGQRDAALEDLVEAGLARLDSSGPLVVAEPVRAGEEVAS